MSNVTLTIGGRAFTISCAAGEEAHVMRLGNLIDAKIAEAGVVGQSETRMLLFAALMLADDLHNAAPAKPTLPADLGERLGGIAQRIENLAHLLEQDATSA